MQNYELIREGSYHIGKKRKTTVKTVVIFISLTIELIVINMFDQHLTQSIHHLIRLNKLSKAASISILAFAAAGLDWSPLSSTGVVLFSSRLL